MGYTYNACVMSLMDSDLLCRQAVILFSCRRITHTNTQRMVATYVIQQTKYKSTTYITLSH